MRKGRKLVLGGATQYPNQIFRLGKYQIVKIAAIIESFKPASKRWGGGLNTKNGVKLIEISPEFRVCSCVLSILGTKGILSDEGY